jgi:2'-5' RNA ligase
MYLVSIYFDEKTNKKLQQYINNVAERTGNTFMLDEKVPPHITVSAFETTDEGGAIDILNKTALKLKSGTLEWVPHSTIGKKLSRQEMKVAFDVLHNCFSPLEGTVVRIGLAKPNPHRDIASWELM